MEKTQKIEYTCAHFFLFYIFIFIQNQKKKTEIEIYSIEFSIFPFLDQNRTLEKLKLVALDSYFSISLKKWEKKNCYRWFVPKCNGGVDTWPKVSRQVETSVSY